MPQQKVVIVGGGVDLSGQVNTQVFFFKGTAERGGGGGGGGRGGGVMRGKAPSQRDPAEGVVVSQLGQALFRELKAPCPGAPGWQ